MLMFDFLQAMNPDLNPAEAKLHLATATDRQHPLDVYLAGNFNDWQRWQNAKNFERRFVISLIDMPHQKNKWLFAGVYRSNGSERKWSEEYKKHYNWYELTEEQAYKEMNGRLVVSFSRPGRLPIYSPRNGATRFFSARYIRKGNLSVNFRASRPSILQKPNSN